MKLLRTVCTGPYMGPHMGTYRFFFVPVPVRPFFSQFTVLKPTGNFPASGYENVIGNEPFYALLSEIGICMLCYRKWVFTYLSG